MSYNKKLLLIWIALVAVFVLAHFRFFFLESFTELGDSAVNALEIRKAKSFAALYGNYSRWRFHHPGPAFFYAYAAGESMLHDLLHLVPSPYSAHMIAGIIMQTGFFIWTLSILRRHVRYPFILPLVLIAGALHFGAVNYHMIGSSFESIWPPYVLLFPFLCFLVACAAIASGSAIEILPAIVSGGMLVHGHVAQPLFVLPFFTLAIVAFVTRSIIHHQSIGAELRKHSNRLILSAVLLTIFLLPIVLDCLKGPKSNLHQILLHFSQHSDDHKSIAQSLAYFCTFFCYVFEPEKIFDSAGKAHLGFLSERWPFTVVWIVITAALLAFMPIAFKRSSPFVRWLYLYLGIGIALTICWGILQNGPMLSFNSHFNFALLFVAIVLVLIGICAYLPAPGSPRPAIILCFAAIPLYLPTAYSWRFNSTFHDQQQVTQFPELADIARNEPDTTKYLRFNQSDWPAVAGVAIALERLGFQFAVAHEWEFMFGAEHKLNPATAMQEKRVSIWNFGPRQENITGFQLSNGLFVRRSAPPINPHGSEIIFGGPDINATEYLIEGWDISNEPYAWSTSKAALLYFHPQPAITEVNIGIDIFPAAFSKNKSQRVIISFNGSLRRDYVITAHQTVNLQIPATIWNQQGDDYLLFEFPDAISPLAAGVSQDPREISCGFIRIEFEETKVAPAD
jgi:hypothetical protein